MPETKSTKEPLDAERGDHIRVRYYDMEHDEFVECDAMVIRAFESGSVKVRLPGTGGDDGDDDELLLSTYGSVQIPATTRNVPTGRRIGREWRVLD